MSGDRLTICTDLAIEMRDGAVLRADLYRPAGDGPFPTIVARTPYGKQLADPARPWLRFALAGFAVLVQDCRGCFGSEGTFVPFADEMNDGYDTVQWAASQSWSTGSVGMFGTSYLGVTQWLAAAARPPGLKTIVPAMTAADYHDGWIYQGGAFQLSFALGWALPFAIREARRRPGSPDVNEAAVRDIASAMASMAQGLRYRPLAEQPSLKHHGVARYYREWVDHPDADDYWEQWNIESRHVDITIPVLALSGWYDMFLGGTIRNHLGMKRNGGSEVARRHQRLVLGPWAHGKPLFGGNPDPAVDFGPAASGGAIDIDGLAIRWFRRWLCDEDNGVTDEPPIKYFTIGPNTWRDAPTWPVPGTTYLDLYAHSSGRANTAAGDGTLDAEQPWDEPPDVFVYDPRFPVPTTGGGAFLNDGAKDQRRVEERADVLVYTSDPLSDDVELTGPVAVTLYAGSSATDTDFTAKLVVVSPDGFAMNLADNIMRARYRDGLADQRLLTPGVVEQYVVDLFSISAVIRQGHRLRLEISSSNFPRFDANPNTGGAFGYDGDTVPAVQTVHHDRRFATRITLPVVGATGPLAALGGTPRAHASPPPSR